MASNFINHSLHTPCSDSYHIKKASNAMKKILISCATHDAHCYQTVLKSLNVEPVLSDKIEDEQEYDGLLLPGGGDISPIFYHCRNLGCKDICITEDIIQLLLFHRFYEKKKPILGICKGMQLINVALHGTLLQKLPTEQMHIWNESDNYHNTMILPGSLLYKMYGKELLVNSAHHQAVQKLGHNLIAIQYSFDGTIEGLEHNSLPILGVQWHPERLCSGERPYECAFGMPIFEWFASKL